MADHETSPAGEVPGITELGRVFGEPAREETTPPVTMLDAIVLDTITKFGNDNLPPEPDPYDRYSTTPQLDRDSHTVSLRTHKMEFGLGYLTHHFQLPGAVVLLTYSKRFGRAGVVIDRFAAKGGLASRTVFWSNPESPQEITKVHQTEFDSHDPMDVLLGVPDFDRPLKSQEMVAFSELLDDPTERHDRVEVLTTVSAEEVSMTTRNRKERQLELAEYRRSTESIIEARKAAWREADRIWIG